MSYKTFREFVVLKEAPAQQMTPMNTMQSANPQHKAQVVKNLMALQKAPPPAGVNPQQMQNNVRNAINIAKTNVSNAANAMDYARAMNALQQQ
jgi:hypothetical protein